MDIITVKATGRSGGCNSSSSSSVQSEEDMNMELRRGPWTVEEDLTLINYIANHGEGRWNSLARCAGLKRTGKSCRLRWLNYLRPDVRRGNITLEEQLLILELHSRWGNRWSKIAQHLPGRTDNEIKNYWRTRVQKHAKQLKCDVNSKQFKDTMRYLWMPRLVERIQAAATTTATSAPAATNVSLAAASSQFNNNHNNTTTNNYNNFNGQVINTHEFGAALSYTPENSSTAASSDSFGTQVSPVSDLTDYYSTTNTTTSTTTIPVNNSPNPDQYFQATTNQQVGYHHQYYSMTSPSAGYNNNNNDENVNNLMISSSTNIHNQGLLDFQAMEQNSISQYWIDGVDPSDNWWDVEDIWLLQQAQLNNGI